MGTIAFIILWYFSVALGLEVPPALWALALLEFLFGKYITVTVNNNK